MHPNVVLVLRLTPEGLPSKTYEDILADEKIYVDDGGYSSEIEIDGDGYDHHLMEDSYYEDYQISASEGDIIVFDLVTYGYGECIEWESLLSKKTELEKWALPVCEKHSCKASVFITANYW